MTLNVKLISYTGIGNPDPNFAARLLIYAKSTRLSQSDETEGMIARMEQEDLDRELAYIANTIRSSWEFVDYVFRITGATVATLRQMTRSRVGWSFAEQSQRVNDMSRFTYETPPSVTEADGGARWDRAMATIRDTYSYYRTKSVPQEDARGLLPMNAHSAIIAKPNLSSLAALLPKRDNPRAQAQYRQMALLMEAAVLGVHPWAKTFLRPERTLTPSLDAILRELAAHGDKSAALAAQKELDTLKATWG